MTSVARGWLMALALLPGTLPGAPVSVQDDAGRRVELAAPARRIVSLAPHATELLFAAGAGDRVVGVMGHSDHPPAARTLPRLGSHAGLELERLLALDPDLVVAWGSGNGPRVAARLEGLGLAVFVSEPRSLEAVATSLERLGRLAGSPRSGDRAAAEFRARRDALAGRHAGQPALAVFYQVWGDPLMTVNGDHLISALLRLCGGRNVFAGLPTLAPRVSLEAVLAASPEVIVAGVAEGSAEAALAPWRDWPGVPAVAARQLHALPADLLNRPGPRVLDGAELLCARLAWARAELAGPRGALVPPGRGLSPAAP